MNRKEIIVFSVFVNTGLLFALFLFALRPTLKGEMNLDSHEVVIVGESKNVEAPKKSDLDQVDQILKEYIAKADNPSKPVLESIVQQEPLVTETLPTLEDQTIEVIVRGGDVLEKIAKRHHTTVEEIMFLNKMKSSKLRIGQILLVKENTRKKMQVKALNPTLKKDVEQKYYTVKTGDSPWTIAIKNHIKVSELLELNDLNEARAKKIKPGDKLRIR